MSKINFSQLKHHELPTKEVEVELSGEKQSISIKPISGRGITSMSTLNSTTDLDAASKICLIAIMYGLEISQKDAELLMNVETEVADLLASEILTFTKEYTEKQAKAKEVVKKK